MTTPRVLVIAVGSKQNGASGLAPALLEALRSLPLAESWWLTLVTDIDFQLEHALYLQNADLALFVDCRPDALSPFEFRELDVTGEHRILAPNESLAPSDVVHILATIGRRNADIMPPSFQLTLSGEQLTGHEGLSAAAAANLTRGAAFVEQLLARPGVDDWRAELTGS